jgi:hypothetical protein
MTAEYAVGEIAMVARNGGSRKRTWKQLNSNIREAHFRRAMCLARQAGPGPRM